MSSNVKAAAILGACVVIAAAILGRQVSRLADIVERKQFASSFSSSGNLSGEIGVRLDPSRVLPVRVRDGELTQQQLIAFRMTIETRVREAVAQGEFEGRKIGGYPDIAMVRHNVDEQRIFVSGSFYSGGERKAFAATLEADGFGRYVGDIVSGETILLSRFSVEKPHDPQVQ